MIAALLPEKVICVAKRGDDVVYTLFSEEEAAVGKASVGLRPRRGRRAPRQFRQALDSPEYHQAPVR